MTVDAGRPVGLRNGALYSQIIGRGTRICPGKDHLLVLDFLWQSAEHNLIKPAHLIAEDEEDARELTARLGDDGDLEHARKEVDADRTRMLSERRAARSVAFIIGDWLVYGQSLFGTDGDPDK